MKFVLIALWSLVALVFAAEQEARIDDHGHEIHEHGHSHSEGNDEHDHSHDHEHEHSHDHSHEHDNHDQKPSEQDIKSFMEFLEKMGDGNKESVKGLKENLEKMLGDLKSGKPIDDEASDDQDEL